MITINRTLHTATDIFIILIHEKFNTGLLLPMFCVPYTYYEYKVHKCYMPLFNFLNSTLLTFRQITNEAYQYDFIVHDASTK